MVERTNGGIRLGDFMKKHIWEPLGMTSTGFRLAENETIRRNLCATTARTPEGKLVPTAPYPAQNPRDDLGGGGMYSSAKDYVKVLVALLKNDGVLLSPKTVKTMFEPQLHDNRDLAAVVTPTLGSMYRAGVESQAWDFGLGGILNMEDVDGICKKGTMTWGGLPNLFWVCSNFVLLDSLSPEANPCSGSIHPQGRAECLQRRFFRRRIPHRLLSHWSFESIYMRSREDETKARVIVLSSGQHTPDMFHGAL